MRLIQSAQQILGGGAPRQKKPGCDITHPGLLILVNLQRQIQSFGFVADKLEDPHAPRGLN